MTRAFSLTRLLLSMSEHLRFTQADANAMSEYRHLNYVVIEVPTEAMFGGVVKPTGPVAIVLAGSPMAALGKGRDGVVDKGRVIMFTNLAVFEEVKAEITAHLDELLGYPSKRAHYIVVKK